MSDSASRTIKSKKLGVLMRDARQVKNKSLEECAQAIGAAPETFEAYELGQQTPSLPELEILAYTLKVTVDHFLSEDGLLQNPQPVRQPELQKLLTLRQKIIGVLLRKARAEKGLTLEEVAGRTGIQAEQLEAYEYGQTPIPVTELKLLSQELGWQIRAFQDTVGPVGVWNTQQHHYESFSHLGAEMQDFISKPVNRPYLEVAQRLSEMSADRLRVIAETLLEITL